MSGSSFGKIFRITTWGESHGPGIGVVIDGCPAGLALSEEQIREFDSCIIKKLLTGRIKPVFFCQVFCFIT